MLQGLTRPLVPVATLALGVLGAVAFSAATVQAPAFNETLQVEGITGSPRVPDLAAMYNHGDYLFQTGRGFLVADLLSFEGIEGRDEVASVETAAERIARARTLIEASLVLAPGNARAWIAYAESLAGLGESDGAAAAMEISWRLAPTMSDVALRRLFLIESLRLVTQMPDAHAAIHAADSRVVEMHEPENLLIELPDLPALPGI